MNLTRRSMVIGLPVATSSLLTACGGGDDAAAEGASPERAQAQALAVSGPPPSGQIWVTANSLNFPSYAKPFKPDPVLIQACWNGNTIHVDLCHQPSSTEPLRSLVLKLNKSSAWLDDQDVIFTAYNEATATASQIPLNNVTGLIAHLQAPTPTTASFDSFKVFASNRYFHRIVSGKVTARKKGDSLTLTFDSNLTNALTATKMNALVNKAPASGTVRIVSTSTRPSVMTVRLSEEHETSI